MARRGANWFKEDVVAWVVALVTVGGALAGGHYWLHRRVVESGVPGKSAVADPRIVALAFDRIVAEPDEDKVDAVELRAHLTSLRDAGFVPVTLAALAAFFEEGTPLPAKSLLLTFDHGYLSTFSVVDPILREMRWNAVLFVMTERQERRDPFFVYWDRIDRMTRSGLWEVGSHGHEGHDPIALDRDGNEGPFFIRKLWLEPRGRVETWEEFRDRVASDHERANRRLEEGTGGEVLAYAPPLRDIAGLSDTPEAHRITDAIVRSNYRLAFYDDRFGVNDERSDPHRLKRLRVDPRWSSEELTARLDFALGEQRETHSGRSPWVLGDGSMSSEDGELIVTGDARADVWRAGSPSAEDWELEVEFRIEGGEFWVVQESDERFEEWRFGGTRSRIYVQVREAGERTRVLKSFERGIEPGGWHRLRLVKRGLGVMVELDSEPVGDLPTLLPGRWRGAVGLVHWKDEGAPPRMRLREARFAALAFQTLEVSSELTREEIREAVADVERLSSLSPRLYEIDAGGIVRRPSDETLLAMLSHRFAWEILPRVRLVEDEEWMIHAVLEAVDREGFGGLHVELDALAPPARALARQLLVEAARERSWREGRLVLSDTSAPIRAGT